MKHTLKKSLAVLLAMLTLLGMTAAGAAAEEPGVAELPEEALIIDAKELPTPAAEAEAEEEEAAVVSDEVPEAAEEAEDATDDMKKAAASDLDFQSAEELFLGQPKAVSLSGWNYKMFKFTPAASGKYCFRSNGAQYSSTSYMDPYAWLYDKDYDQIADDNDDWTDKECTLNFAIYRALEAGKTYYLETRAYNGGDYTVRVETFSQKLVVPQTEIAFPYGKYISVEDLVKGTTWDTIELRFDGARYDKSVLNHVRKEDGPTTGFIGYKPGAETLTVTAPDGEQIQIKVKVKLTFWSWIKYYLLGDWWFTSELERIPKGVGERLGILLEHLYTIIFIAPPTILFMFIYWLGGIF